MGKKINKYQKYVIFHNFELEVMLQLLSIIIFQTPLLD